MKIFSKTPKAFVLPVALLCSSVWADVSYIDESGEVAYVKDGDYTILTSGASLNNPNEWYVVQNEVVYTSQVYSSSNVKLILADGASLTIDVSGATGITAKDIYIYGQTKQTGKLRITSKTTHGIYADNIYIAGGDVDVSGGDDGIHVGATPSTIAISGGVVKASGKTNGLYSINGTVEISGGSVSALGTNESGIKANGISLGWSKNTNTIVATSYSTSDVTIVTNESFISDGSLLSGTVSVNDINGKTLRPYDPPIKVNGTSITINGDYNGLNTIEESLLDIDFGEATSRSFDNVTFNRTFPLNKYSTFMLPFAVNTNQLSGIGTLLRYNGITKDNGKVTIQMSRSVGERLSAYTPYMVLMDDPTLTVQGPVTLSKNVSATPVSSDECEADPNGTYCEWKMYGSQAYKKWTTEDLDRVKVYGFAAEAKSEKIYIGKFVKAGAGAWIRAFRGFLADGDGSTPPAQGRARYNKPVMSSIEQPELPAEIDVVIVDDDEKTTVIGKMNTRTGEIMMNRDFDLKGRRVGNNKAAHGAYYGKKVLKK